MTAHSPRSPPLPALSDVSYSFFFVFPLPMCLSWVFMVEQVLFRQSGLGKWSYPKFQNNLRGIFSFLHLITPLYQISIKVYSFLLYQTLKSISRMPRQVMSLLPPVLRPVKLPRATPVAGPSIIRPPPTPGRCSFLLPSVPIRHDHFHAHSYSPFPIPSLIPN